MRTVVATGPGIVELNFMWLPTWLGLNSAMKQELENELGPGLVGKELTDDELERAHVQVLTFFERKFPNIRGLRDHLDSLKFVVPE